MHPRLRRWLGGSSESDPSETVQKPELFATGIANHDVFEEHLRVMLARSVSMFVGFSGGWSEYYNYKNQFYDLFPQLDFEGRLTLRTYEFAAHTFNYAEHRRRLFGDIIAWAKGCRSVSGT